MPNFSVIKVLLTLRCNRSCGHCVSGCDMFPSSADISAETLSSFAAQVSRLATPRDWIAISGGEPCLHPRFRDCCDLLARSLPPRTHCKVFTNGDFPEAYASLPPGWVVYDSAKAQRGRGWWSAFYQAPCDLPHRSHEDFGSHCRVQQKCGICLATNGRYYFCTMASTIDRVFGLDAGFDSLAALMSAKWSTMARFVCRYCGVRYDEQAVSNELSPSWQARKDRKD